MYQKIEHICLDTMHVDNLEMVTLLKNLVPEFPEYISNNSVYEKLDKG